MDQMMPKGREDEAPKVLREDIDIQAAETLHGVVTHMASAGKVGVVVVGVVVIGVGGVGVVGIGVVGVGVGCCCC